MKDVLAKTIVYGSCLAVSVPLVIICLGLTVMNRLMDNSIYEVI